MAIREAPERVRAWRNLMVAGISARIGRGYPLDLPAGLDIDATILEEYSLIACFADRDRSGACLTHFTILWGAQTGKDGRLCRHRSGRPSPGARLARARARAPAYRATQRKHRRQRGDPDDARQHEGGDPRLRRGLSVPGCQPPRASTSPVVASTTTGGMGGW
jgi:hypothetical protein